MTEPAVRDVQGLRINFFIWVSQRGLGDDASKRRNAYAGDSSNRWYAVPVTVGEYVFRTKFSYKQDCKKY